ncbi:MAG: hypothetical protein AAF721_23450 [Myxococcota bacterium]
MNLRSLPLSLFVFAAGCVVWIREPEAYRDEIVELVEVRDEAIAGCYDAVLAQAQHEAEKIERADQGPYADIGPAVKARTGDLHGTVGVRFVAARRTGAITASLVPEATTAPQGVADCVVEHVGGLQLEPADERDGRVTLLFRLESGSRQARAPAQPPS